MLDAVPPYPFGLTFDVDDVHLSHVHAERLLHSLLDLVLVAGAANLKHVLVIAAEARSLLRDERSQEDVQRVDGLRHRLRLLLPGPWPPGGGLGLLRRRFGFGASSTAAASGGSAAAARLRRGFGASSTTAVSAASAVGFSTAAARRRRGFGASSAIAVSAASPPPSPST